MKPMLHWIQSAQVHDQAAVRAAGRPDLGAFLHLIVAADDCGPADRGPLTGVTVCVKDVIDVAGAPTTLGAAGVSVIPARDAEAVRRLRAAGAIVVGKGATNEYALGIDGLNPHTGDCRNPHDPDRMSGGSSSGPAVAVAAGLADLGLGTDTTGSIRVPAAFCGIVGIRPGRGRVPAEGVFPLSPDYDRVGPLAPDVRGAALALGVLADDDELLSWAADPDSPVPGLGGVRLGVLTSLHPGACDVRVAAQLDAALDVLRAAGVRAEPLVLGELWNVEEAHLVLQLHQAAAVHAPFFAARRGAYAPGVRDLLERGRGYDAVKVAWARGERQRWRRALAACFDAGIDALVAPAAPVPAPPRDAVTVELVDGPSELRGALLACCIPFSQGPGATVALPMGEVDGLPVGLQLHGPANGDRALCALALAVERALVKGMER